MWNDRVEIIRALLLRFHFKSVMRAEDTTCSWVELEGRVAPRWGLSVLKPGESGQTGTSRPTEGLQT